MTVCPRCGKYETKYQAKYKLKQVYVCRDCYIWLEMYQQKEQENERSSKKN